MYENAFRLGVTPRPLTPDVMNDSYSELMGTKENLDSKYPKVCFLILIFSVLNFSDLMKFKEVCLRNFSKHQTFR